jgi:hypothetical protein
LDHGLEYIELTGTVKEGIRGEIEENDDKKNRQPAPRRREKET